MNVWNFVKKYFLTFFCLLAALEREGENPSGSIIGFRKLDRKENGRIRFLALHQTEGILKSRLSPSLFIIL
jgi:hypothetical protein